MNDELDRFEEQLRRVAPASCDHLKDDAMYRAGWNAAQSVFALRSSSASSGRQSIPAFATGMICGLLFCGVGLTAWQWRSIESDGIQNQIVAAPEVIPMIATVPPVESNSVTVDDANEALPDPQQQHSLSSLVALLMPWISSPVVGQVDLTPQAAKPLSRAARQQWSQLLAESAVVTGRRNPAEPSNDDDSHILRTRPATNLPIEDLL